MKGATLKWIAIVTMLVDHVGVLLYRNGMAVEGYNIMRGIGRLAFPIFVFLLVEGFINTKNFKKYLLRLLTVAVVTEPIFDMYMHGGLFLLGCNTVFSLTISLVVLFFYKKAESGNTANRILAVVVAILATAVAYVLKFEYSWKCVLIVSVLYLFRYNTPLKITAMGLILVADSSVLGLAALLALVPIALYNGERGKFPKWVAYIFYPAHLLVLLIIGGVVNV